MYSILLTSRHLQRYWNARFKLLLEICMYKFATLLPSLPSIRHMSQRPTMLMRAIRAICRIDICILRYNTYHFIIHRCQISSSRKLANVDRLAKISVPAGARNGEKGHRGWQPFSRTRATVTNEISSRDIRHGNGTLIYKSKRGEGRAEGAFSDEK